MRWSQEVESTHVLLRNTSTLAEIQYIPCFTYVFIMSVHSMYKIILLPSFCEIFTLPLLKRQVLSLLLQKYQQNQQHNRK